MKQCLSTLFVSMVATSVFASAAIIEVDSLDYAINNTRTVTTAVHTEDDQWRIEIAIHGVLLDSAEGEIRKEEFAGTPFMQWVNDTNVIADVSLSITRHSKPKMTTLSFTIPDSQRSRCLITFWTPLKRTGGGAYYYIPAGILLDEAKRKKEAEQQRREQKPAPYPEQRKNAVQER